MTYSNLKARLTLWIARGVTAALCAALFVCANTNSSCMIHQPEVPAALEKFKKFK